MTNVLRMPAFELCHPIVLRVLVKSDDASFDRHLSCPLSGEHSINVARTSSGSLPSLPPLLEAPPNACQLIERGT